MAAANAEKDRDIEAQAESKHSTAGSPPPTGVSTAFRDVRFAYPSSPQRPVLDGLSFDIVPGQIIGTGRDKRSRHQRPPRPRVPGRHGARASGQRAVPRQRAVQRWAGGPPGHDATEAEIEEACRTANIHDTVMALPNGYGTERGPNGSRLSGG
ncbi:hypothetical protein DL771_006578 [Monosporascus sp. 5C6A]|nr:hypothetical protein DL771_006578 [Monosporascus sp. 5C6A]